jgi:hypothetical protein
MTLEAQFVDALREHVGTGVLGRMLDVLGTEGYSVGPFGIDRDAPILEGDEELARQVDVVRNSGAERFYQRKVSDVSEADMIEYFKTLNGASELNSGLFANHFSKTFINSANKTEFLRQVADDVALTQWYSGELGGRLQMVSKLILSHAERNTNRDAFFIQLGEYDTHGAMKAILNNRKFPDLNKGIKSFYQELKVAGMLEKVTFVLGSEFGRVSFDEVQSSIKDASGNTVISHYRPHPCFLYPQTLTPNTSGGTDHAWGGNYFAFGGGMKGGRILGHYPESMTESDPTNDGRGRLIPTT